MSQGTHWQQERQDLYMGICTGPSNVLSKFQRPHGIEKEWAVYVALDESLELQCSPCKFAMKNSKKG